MRSLYLLAAVVSVTSLFGMARADVTPSPSYSATEEVSYADLDLRLPESQAKLERRIRAAANRLCREDDPSPAGGHIDARCFKAAVTGALQQVEKAVTLARARPAFAAEIGRRKRPDPQ